jgi:hypothetical protein
MCRRLRSSTPLQAAATTASPAHPHDDCGGGGLMQLLEVVLRFNLKPSLVVIVFDCFFPEGFEKFLFFCLYFDTECL